VGRSESCCSCGWPFPLAGQFYQKPVTKRKINIKHIKILYDWKLACRITDARVIALQNRKEEERSVICRLKYKPGDFCNIQFD
jgi:hypothetical protein